MRYSIIDYLSSKARGTRRLASLIVALCSSALIILLFTPRSIRTSIPSGWELRVSRPSQHPLAQTDHGTFKKPWDTVPSPSIPEGVKVIGLVFYGRKQFVRILNCYLQRNLKKNGGLLDEVIFVANTRSEEDKDYLDQVLLPGEPAYRKFNPRSGNYSGWTTIWTGVDDPDAIYIKIDDDIVFIEDNTIPALVQRLLLTPSYFAVSANVVNNPALSWVHGHQGVYYPYWPEMEQPSVQAGVTWRASELPAYDGPLRGPPEFKADGSTPAPFGGHRWLPVRTQGREAEIDIGWFPVSTMTYDAFGPSLHNWAAAAQSHYSFLQHLEQEDIWRYKFDVWDYNFARLSINFFALRGKDIIDAFPFPTDDDEGYLTVDLPRKLNRHVIVDGTGLAVHFAYGNQMWADDWHGIALTDLVPRYDAYAQENICETRR